MTIKTFAGIIIFFALIYFIAEGQRADVSTINYGNNKDAGHYVELNGVKLYYEEYGKGEPLILLHGNGGDIKYMKPQIEYFSKKYKVIAMDCRGRGNSELGKDSLTFNQMTKDLNSLLEYLHLDSTYIIGRSDGGIIALLLAIYYPDKVKKIASFAANVTPDTNALYGNDEVTKDRIKAEAMMAKHDTTQNWLLIQQRMRLMEFQPYIYASDLKKIKCPVLIMSTDRDLIKIEHTVFIYQNIPKSNLCIFTGETHGVSSTNPILFNTTIDKYFIEPYKGDEIRY